MSSGYCPAKKNLIFGERYPTYWGWSDLKVSIFLSRIFCTTTGPSEEMALSNISDWFLTYYCHYHRHSTLRKQTYTLRRKVLQSTFFGASVCRKQRTLFSTWKDHDRNVGVHMDPKIPIMVLPGTIWSFQVLNRVLYL